MSLRLVLVMSVLLVLLAACASTTSRTAAPAVAIGVEIARPLQTLVETRREPSADPELGTYVNFQIPEWPWVHFDLFVYRAGVTDELPKALEIAADGFRRDLEQARAHGISDSEPFRSEGAFEVQTHPLTAKGWRARFDFKRADEPFGSLAYLFYRPPFMLKVRASFPAHADGRTDAAVDAAVRELIPAIRATAPVACAKHSIDIELPADLESQPKAEQEKVFLVTMSQSVLHSALQGCVDLEAALAGVKKVCERYGALCGSPPWSSGKDAAAAQE